MKAQFTVGKEEKHTVEIDSSRWTGRLKIRVDGKEVLGTFRSQWSTRFDVGRTEKHKVEIRMRGLMYPTIELLVDGKLEGSMLRFGTPGM